MTEVLPGRWRIMASNLLQWLSGEQVHPVVELQLSSAEPLVLAEEVRFLAADGKHHSVRSRAVWTGDGFVTRGDGILKPVGRRWQLGGVNDDGTIVVVRHFAPRAARAQSVLGRLGRVRPNVGGIDVMVRDGVDGSQVRAQVARDFDAFRLSLEEFASLGWLPEGRPQ